MSLNRINNLIALLFCLTILNCGGKEEKKEEDIYGSSRKEKKKSNDSSSKDEEIIDLTNKGIGPISSLTFDNDVDETLVNKGEEIFGQKCVACHRTNQKYIGPAMKGIYEKRAPEWVMNMILNPEEMIKKDPIAKQQYEAYNKTMMVGQNLTEDDARAVAEYLRTL